MKLLFYPLMSDEVIPRLKTKLRIKSQLRIKHVRINRVRPVAAHVTLFLSLVIYPRKIPQYNNTDITIITVVIIQCKAIQQYQLPNLQQKVNVFFYSRLNFWVNSDPL